jgi:hypothetical protein
MILERVNDRRGRQTLPFTGIAILSEAPRREDNARVLTDAGRGDSCGHSVRRPNDNRLRSRDIELSCAIFGSSACHLFVYLVENSCNPPYYPSAIAPRLTDKFSPLDRARLERSAQGPGRLTGSRSIRLNRATSIQGRRACHNSWRWAFRSHAVSPSWANRIRLMSNQPQSTIA